MCYATLSHYDNDRKQRQNDAKTATILVLSYYYLAPVRSKCYYKQTMTDVAVWLKCYMVSSRVGTSSFLREPPFLGTPSFWSKFEMLPPLSESHPNWYMQIVRNTIKWRCYVSYYSKSIENIISSTLFTSRLNSVFLLLTLPLAIYCL